MNIITTLGLKHLFRMKKAHDAALKYLRGYIVSECVCALSKEAILDNLLEDNKFDVTCYAKNKNLDEEVLKAIFSYLYSLKILNKDGNSYWPSTIGRFIFDYAKGPFDFASAYSEIFTNLGPLLKKEKKYYIDIKRIDYLVAKASAETEEWIPYPVVKRILKKYNFKNMLDLGCGNAEFLIKSCEENTALRGYGIDMSSEAIARAEIMLNSSEARHRIELRCGDIFDRRNFPAGWGEKIDVVTCMFVLHEFASGDDARKLSILLTQLKKDFKDAYLIICELCRKTPEELRVKPTLIAEHHLFHALSNQDLLSYDSWKKIFKETHYDVVEEIKFAPAGQNYFVLK